MQILSRFSQYKLFHESAKLVRMQFELYTGKDFLLLTRLGLHLEAGRARGQFHQLMPLCWTEKQKKYGMMQLE